MKIAKQYLGMVCVLALSMFISLGAQDEAINKKQAYGQALYERTCDIVDDNDAQKSAGNVVQKIVADESIYEFLNLGKQEGYTLDELLESAKKVAQENEDQEVAQILEDVQEEMSKNWFSKHPIMLVAIAASGIAAYVKWDFLQQLFSSYLEKFGLKDKLDKRTEAEKKADEEEAERKRLATEKEAQREQEERERLAREEKQREQEAERKKLADLENKENEEKKEREKLAAEEKKQREEEVERERLAKENKENKEKKEREKINTDDENSSSGNDSGDFGVSSDNETNLSDTNSEEEKNNKKADAAKLGLEKLKIDLNNSDEVPDFLLDSIGETINNTQNLANRNTEQDVDNTQQQNQGENLKDSLDDLPELVAIDDNEQVVDNTQQQNQNTPINKNVIIIENNQ